MNNKTLLILGAGVYQEPLIKKSLELNINTIVAAKKNNLPGEKLAKFFDIDITDKISIFKLAQSHDINGIISTGSDAAIPAIGEINSKLKLIGPKKESCEKLANKIKMKKVFAEHKIMHAKYFTFLNRKEFLTKVDNFKYPFVLKPSDLSGSKGVKIVSSLELALSYIENEIPKYAKEFICEEFIEGIEVGAQAIIHDGYKTQIIIHNDHVTKGSVPIPFGHSLPFQMPRKIKKLIEETCINAINSFSLTNCIVNFDLIVNNDKIYIIELSPRIGGTCIPEILSYAGNQNIYEYLINLTLGKAREFKLDNKQYVSGFLIKSDKSGILKKYSINKNYDKSSIKEHVMDNKVGDKVRKFDDGTCRIGHVIFKANNLVDLNSRKNLFFKNLLIKVE